MGNISTLIAPCEYWAATFSTDVRLLAQHDNKEKQSFPCKCTVWHVQLGPWVGNNQSFKEILLLLLVQPTKPLTAWPFSSNLSLSLALSFSPSPVMVFHSRSGPLRGEREIHSSVAIVQRQPCLLPCIVSISSRNPVAMALKMALQPLCLMISWMIAHLSDIHALFCWNTRHRGMSCSLQKKKKSSVVMWTFLSKHNWWWSWC